MCFSYGTAVPQDEARKDKDTRRYIFQLDFLKLDEFELGSIVTFSMVKTK